MIKIENGEVEVVGMAYELIPEFCGVWEGMVTTFGDKGYELLYTAFNDIGKLVSEGRGDFLDDMMKVAVKGFCDGVEGIDNIEEIQQTFGLSVEEKKKRFTIVK